MASQPASQNSQHNPETLERLTRQEMRLKLAYRKQPETSLLLYCYKQQDGFSRLWGSLPSRPNSHTHDPRTKQPAHHSDPGQEEALQQSSPLGTVDVKTTLAVLSEDPQQADLADLLLGPSKHTQCAVPWQCKATKMPQQQPTAGPFHSPAQTSLHLSTNSCPVAPCSLEEKSFEEGATAQIVHIPARIVQTSQVLLPTQDQLSHINSCKRTARWLYKPGTPLYRRCGRQHTNPVV
jgi:hypothetical protein